MFSDLLHRLRALLRRTPLEAELDEELRAHLEREVEKYVRSGLPGEEAARRARLEFGGLDQVKEECRDARGVNFVETLFQDARHGLRVLAKNPGFTAVAVLHAGAQHRCKHGDLQRGERGTAARASLSGSGAPCHGVLE